MQESPYLDDTGFLLNKLKQLPFMGEFGTEYVKHVLRISKLRKYEDEEAITLEGTYESWVYILFSGAIKVSIHGREISRAYEVGSTFGEVSALDGKMRSATVEAIGATVCLAIDVSFMKVPGEPLEKAVLASLLYKHFSEVLAGRLRKKDEDLEKASIELDRARTELVKLRRDLPRLRHADEDLKKVTHELSELKKTVAKRWLLVKDDEK